MPTIDRQSVSRRWPSARSYLISCWRQLARALDSGSRHTHIRRSMKLIVVVVGTWLGAPAVAFPNSYVHYSCHTPDGLPAPIEGWSRTFTGTLNTCGDTTSLGSLRGEMHSDFGPTNSVAGWTYTPPPAGRLVRFVASRLLWQFAGPGPPCGSDTGGICGPYEYLSSSRLRYLIDLFAYGTGPRVTRTESTYRDLARVGVRPLIGTSGFAPPFSPSDSYVHDSRVQAIGIPEVAFAAFCRNAERGRRCDEPSPSYPGVLSAPAIVSFFEVFMLKAYIEDNAPPTVTAVGGPLASNATHSGVEKLTFSATDTGGGLYRAVAEAKINNTGDWTPLSRASVDENRGKCVDLGFDVEAYEFSHQVPCRQSITDATLSVDTTRLPAGNHALRVYVEDAAGNTAPIIANRPFSVIATPGAGAVFDRPSSTGGGASELAATNGSGANIHAVLRLSGSKRTVGFGRAATISGRLVDEDDRGIVGATIAVQERSYVPKTGLEGPAWKTLGSVATMVNGTFKARIPAGASRALRFIYKANRQQTGYTTAAEVRISVRAE